MKKKREKSPKNQISISTQPKKKPMGYGKEQRRVNRVED